MKLELCLLQQSLMLFSLVGKTVLAAESLRSSSLLREVFIGGVYWLSVGRMYTKEGEIDMPALLEKLQNFIVRMDKDRHRPSNLESATDYLQVSETHSHTTGLRMETFNSVTFISFTDSHE